MTGPPAEDLDIPEAPIPVSVLTGFLGSGKTTVLNRLLAHPDTGETAVIVNEFGEIGLDHLLVESGGQDRPMVIHGVQHIFHPPVLLEAWPDEDRRSRLVFITRGLDKAMFERTLKAFNEQGPGPLDPAAG